MRKVEETRSNHSPAAVPRKAIILDSPNKKKHQTTGTEFYCNFLHSLLKKIPVPIVVVTQNPAPRRSFGPPRIPSKEIEIEEFNGKISGILLWHLDLRTSWARIVCCRQRAANGRRQSIAA